MGGPLRPIGHEDRLTLVEHLDELRTRIIICLVVLGVAFGGCLWQSGAILDFVNRPLQDTAVKRRPHTQDSLSRTGLYFDDLRRGFGDVARRVGALAAQSRDAAAAAQLAGVAQDLRAMADRAPAALRRQPVTIGVAEPFLETLRVAGYAALLISLPVLLYQLFAFLLPAFSPGEREVALPLMLAVPFLFVAGVVFGYLEVLPASLGYLQNFNNDKFDVLIQARELYRFSATLLLSMGLVFQVPVALLAVTRVGIVSVSQLKANRRYALLAAAVIAMFLPGNDPITMIVIMIPLYVLYEASILLIGLVDRRGARAHARQAAEMSAANDAALRPLD